MTNNDSNKIKELLEIIRHKVDMLGVTQTGQSASISMIRDQLSMMNSKLDSHSAALIEIESTLKGYADMYKINGGNVKKLNKRLKKIETKLDIHPQEELMIFE